MYVSEKELARVVSNHMQSACTLSTAKFIPQQSWSITRPVASFRSPGRRFPGFGSDLYVKMASNIGDVLWPSKEASKELHPLWDGWSFDIICIDNELSLWFHLPTRKDSDWITDPLCCFHVFEGGTEELCSLPNQNAIHLEHVLLLQRKAFGRRGAFENNIFF